MDDTTQSAWEKLGDIVVTVAFYGLLVLPVAIILSPMLFVMGVLYLIEEATTNG